MNKLLEYIMVLKNPVKYYEWYEVRQKIRDLDEID